MAHRRGLFLVDLSDAALSDEEQALIDTQLHKLVETVLRERTDVARSGRIVSIKEILGLFFDKIVN